jgi:hypothetical protein
MAADGLSINLFVSESLFVFKIGLIIFAALYFVFTLVVIRQVILMTETVKTVAAPLLKIITIIYSLFALSVVIFFVLAL